MARWASPCWSSSSANRPASADAVDPLPPPVDLRGGHRPGLGPGGVAHPPAHAGRGGPGRRARPRADQLRCRAGARPRRPHHRPATPGAHVTTAEEPSRSGSSPNVLVAAADGDAGPWVHDRRPRPGWGSLAGAILGGQVTATVVEIGGRYGSGTPPAHRRPPASCGPRARYGPVTVASGCARGGPLTTLDAEVSHGGRHTATVTDDLPGRGADRCPGRRPTASRLVARDSCVPIAPPPRAHPLRHNRFVLDPAFEPFSHGQVARVAGYVQPPEPRSIDAPWLVTILDSFPPSAFTRHDPPVGRPASTSPCTSTAPCPSWPPTNGWRPSSTPTSAATAWPSSTATIRDPAGRVLAESFHTRWTAAS